MATPNVSLQVAEAAARLQNHLDLDPLGKPQFKGGFTRWLDAHKEDVRLVLEDRGPIRLAELLRVDPTRFSRWRIANGLQGNASEAQHARHGRISTPKPESPTEQPVEPSVDDTSKPTDAETLIDLRWELAKLEAQRQELTTLIDAMRIVCAHFEELV